MVRKFVTKSLNWPVILGEFPSTFVSDVLEWESQVKLLSPYPGLLNVKLFNVHYDSDDQVPGTSWWWQQFINDGTTIWQWVVRSRIFQFITICSTIHYIPQLDVPKLLCARRTQFICQTTIWLRERTVLKKRTFINSCVSSQESLIRSDGRNKVPPLWEFPLSCRGTVGRRRMGTTPPEVSIWNRIEVSEITPFWPSPREIGRTGFTGPGGDYRVWAEGGETRTPSALAVLKVKKPVTAVTLVSTERGKTSGERVGRRRRKDQRRVVVTTCLWSAPGGPLAKRRKTLHFDLDITT